MSKIRKNIFRVMTDPRGFMKSIPKEDIGKMPLYLAFVIGLVSLVFGGSSIEEVKGYSYITIILASIILAIPVAYISVGIEAILLYFVGKVFKGKASFKELFSAIAYAAVPQFFVLLSWLVSIVIFAIAVFYDVDAQAAQKVFVVAVLVLDFLFYAWGFVLSLHTIGEVQGFSAWYSLFSIILLRAVVIILAFLFLYLLAV